MDLDTLLSFDWSVMAPEFIILGVATLLSIVDLFMPKHIDRRIIGWLSFAGILAAIVSLIGLFDNDVTSILYDTFRLDSFAKAFKLLLLVGAALVMLIVISYEPKDGLKEYHGEFFYLFLTALLGTMIMSSSGDMITLFVGLELLSITSYILAGMRKKHLPSNESAMKYVINGGISTAITLFGFSYIYGLTGATNLKDIGAVLMTITDSQYVYLLGLAFFMVFVGLSFKLASVPFHMWAPDVYQGAPTPVTAFLSVVSKIAGFVIILRFLLHVFAAVPTDGPASMPLLLKVQDYIGFLAGATMIIGNVVALRQRNIKRMFAYSSIAHAGYLLAAITALSLFMYDAIWFYLLAYLLMNLGAFAIIQIVTEKTGTEDISHFAGLYKRSPFLAISMGLFILSLAGFPAMAGFIGKLNIFMGLFVQEQAHYVLGAIMIATTVISYFYYFGVLTQLFFRPAADKEKLRVPVGALLVIVLCLAGTVWFGLVPSSAFDFLHTQFNLADMFQ